MRLLFNILPGNASLLVTKCAEEHSMGASLYVNQQNSSKKTLSGLCVSHAFVCALPCASLIPPRLPVFVPTMPGIPIFPPAQCLAILLSMRFFTDDRQRLKTEKYFCPDSEIQRGTSEKVKLEQKA